MLVSQKLELREPEINYEKLNKRTEDHFPKSEKNDKDLMTKK